MSHEERERQSYPAELGEDARGGQVEPAHHAVRVPRRDGISQDRTEHGPRHRREQAQLERADEVTAHQRVAELGDVGQRPAAVRVLERVDHHDPGRPQQEDRDVAEERDGADPGRNGRPAPGPRGPGAGLGCRSDGHVPSLADGLRPVRRQVIRGVGGLGRAEERWRHGDRGQLRGRGSVDAAVRFAWPPAPPAGHHPRARGSVRPRRPGSRGTPPTAGPRPGAARSC